MKFKVSLPYVYLMLAGIVFMSGCASSGKSDIPASSETLALKNWDFSHGLENWEKSHKSNVKDKWNISVIEEDDSHTNVLDLWRRFSRRDGGHVRAVQQCNFDVSKYSLVRLQADVKVISHTLSDSGWWSDVHGGQGEYPVHFYVSYTDAKNEEHLWSWGFLTRPNSKKKTNFDIVNPSEWYSFTSENLMELIPRPKEIIRVEAGANGWNYHGRVDNIVIEVAHSVKGLTNQEADTVIMCDTFNCGKESRRI